MLIYNVTVKVDAAIADAWLEWMKTEHLPAVVQTGCFMGYKLVRLLEIDDGEGPTYAAQYTAESKADYNRYLEIHAPRLRQEGIDKWGAGVFAFRSLMEIEAEG